MSFLRSSGVRHRKWKLLGVKLPDFTVTKYGCVFLKLGESINVAMDLIPILLGSLSLAHNAQHSLVISKCLRHLRRTGDLNIKF